MNLSLHLVAERDVEEAAAFYEKQATPALAAKFVKEFKRVAKLLAENPGFGSPRSSGKRAFAMNLFPYTLIYRPLPDGIRILVVKHDRRRPGHGGSRR